VRGELGALLGSVEGGFSFHIESTSTEVGGVVSSAGSWARNEKSSMDSRALLRFHEFSSRRLFRKEES
jgi:hypothetical protein